MSESASIFPRFRRIPAAARDEHEDGASEHAAGDGGRILLDDALGATTDFVSNALEEFDGDVLESVCERLLDAGGHAFLEGRSKRTLGDFGVHLGGGGARFAETFGEFRAGDGLLDSIGR